MDDQIKESQESQVKIKMPKYRSNAILYALKIKHVVYDYDLAMKEGRETDWTALIIPEEEGYDAFKVDSDYCGKHTPKAGGYYIEHEDGYQSWASASDLEARFSRVANSAIASVSVMVSPVCTGCGTTLRVSMFGDEILGIDPCLRCMQKGAKNEN